MLTLDEAITCDVCIFNGDVEQGSTMIDEKKHATELGCAEDSRQARLFFSCGSFFYIQKKCKFLWGGGRKKMIFPLGSA